MVLDNNQAKDILNSIPIELCYPRVKHNVLVSDTLIPLSIYLYKRVIVGSTVHNQRNIIVDIIFFPDVHKGCFSVNVYSEHRLSNVYNGTYLKRVQKNLGMYFNLLGLKDHLMSDIKDVLNE